MSINLQAQGRYAEAEPGFQKALSIHPGYGLTTTLKPPKLTSTWGIPSRGSTAKPTKSGEKRGRTPTQLGWSSRSRVWTAAKQLGIREDLAAVLARLGQPEEAWQQLEENLGRGLLDELAARSDRRLSPAERARLLE